MVRQELTLQSKILADLIIIQACVRIGTMQVIVFSEIVVFIFTIDQQIKVVGSKKKILKNQKDKDGKE
jgi:hypothetical protein